MATVRNPHARASAPDSRTGSGPKETSVSAGNPPHFHACADVPEGTPTLMSRGPGTLLRSSSGKVRVAGAVTWGLRAGWLLAVAGEELVAEGLDLPLDGGGVERGVLFGQPALGQGPMSNRAARPSACQAAGHYAAMGSRSTVVQLLDAGQPSRPSIAATAAGVNRLPGEGLRGLQLL